MMQAVTCCRDEAVSHHLSIAAAFWIIWIFSKEECSSLMQNLGQFRCSMPSVILNAAATQYTRSIKGVHRPHWLVQWSHPCSYTHIPVHSPWLPGSIHVTQTILLILTMAGLFLGRPSTGYVPLILVSSPITVVRFMDVTMCSSDFRLHCSSWMRMAHMLIQQHLPPPLSSIVKLSLFTHAHSIQSTVLGSQITSTEHKPFLLTMVGLLLDRSHIV